MSAEPLRVIDGGARAAGVGGAVGDGTCGASRSCRTATWRPPIGGEEFIHFERIGQPWLKEAAKRWARARLLADTAPRTMSSYLSDRGISASGWPRMRRRWARRPCSRARCLRTTCCGCVRSRAGSRRRAISALLAVRLVLEEQREDGLAGLPARRGDPWRGAAARRLPAAQAAPGRGVLAVDRPGEPGAAG